jgi:hypothetical protein
MFPKLNRREFLGTALAAPAAITAAADSAKAGTADTSASTGFNAAERKSLLAAMDEIIPAGDGMPAASAVGGMEYLEHVCRQEPQIRTGLHQALEALQQSTEGLFHAPFPGLSSAQRIETLSALESKSPEIFATLRDRIYESYYTQPSVWKLIGYEFHATNSSGPHMKPFDESVLEKVRKMPKLYREPTQG